MNINDMYAEMTQTYKEAISVLERLEKTNTILEFAKDIKPLKFDWHKDPFSLVDTWSYKDIRDRQQYYVINEVAKLREIIGHIKEVSRFLDELYKIRIGEWEKYRVRNPNDWYDYYKNPICWQFFEEYEKAKNIKSSIYQESKAHREARKKII